MRNTFLGILKRKSTIQPLRYGVIGVVLNSAGYMIYLLVTFLGATPKATMSALYVSGMVISYWGNRRLTFEHEGSALASGYRYLIAHSFGYLINYSLLALFADKFGYPHQWVQAFAIFVVAFFLFFTFKYYVFKESTS